jgi:branched-chain amino acid transport system permease protein
MFQAIQLTFQGVAIGAVYSLVALGLVLTYKATEVMNFAYGDLVMASAFLGWFLIVPCGMPFWMAAVIVVFAMAGLGYAVDANVMRRISGQPQYAGVMLTIAIGFMLRGAVSLWLGPESRVYDTPWSGRSVAIGPAVIGELHVVILVAGLLLTLGLFLVMKYTRVGVAIQAASQNQVAAYLAGVRVKRLNSLVWAMGGGIAAVCGLLLAPIMYVDLNLWTVVLKAFAAMVLGGFGSVPGAIVGGVLMGVIEQFSGLYLPDGFKAVMPYIVLIGVLMVCPRGIFGQSHGRRI